METIKMVITDMDGTLLNSNHEVSNRFFNVFKQLQQQNIKFVAASGRPYYSIIDKLKAIKEDIIIVAENGGLVIKNESVLLKNAITPEKLPELFNLVSKLEDTYPIFCTMRQAFILRADDNLVKTFSEYYSDYTIIDDLEEITEDVIKIALYHSKNSETGIYPFVKHLNAEFNVVVSGNHWVDISSRITNKGHALLYLQNKFNISPSETMAFGDYNNDLEMLKYSDYSYAMENAHPDVKVVANYATQSNDKFGVEIILEKLVSKNGED